MKAWDINDLKNISSTLALIIAMASFWYSRKNWLQSNRPIVSAAIVTHTGGSELIAYNLELYNTGNRPATNIRIHVEENDIKLCLAERSENQNIDSNMYARVIRCFSDDAVIPLLLNGKSQTNSFGYTSNTREIFWRYGASFPIAIEYSDLEGRKFKSIQTLKVKDSAGFADGAWGKVTSK